MAHTNAPAHDFAPPWLKIPSYDSAKPSGAESERGGYINHKEGPSYNTSARHTKESDSFSSRHPSYNDTRRERNAFSGDRKHSYLSSYHQSLDFEDSYFEGNGYHAFPSSSCNGTSNSHSSVRRPHSRHDFRNGPSYGKGDSFNNHMKSNGGYLGRAKLKFSESSTNNSSNSSFNENEGGISVISNNFNQEFPSLQGDVSEEPVSTPVNGSVWEKPRNIKVHGTGVGKKLQLVKKTSHLDSTADSSKRSILAPASSSSLSGSVLGSSGGPTSVNPHTVIVTPVAKSSSGIYRALVPAKSTSSKKLVGKEGGAKVLSSSKKPLSSSTPAPTATYPMEILVKHPKACGNKSEFLKALRNENQSMKEAQDKNLKNSTEESNSSSKEQGGKSHTNGIDIRKLNINSDSEKPLLSSSLEAEERLLREMGWKDEVSDDDNYAPLTEDEMREFKALSEQIAKKNGIRRNLQANFSPRRLAPFPTTVVPLPADNSTSSSESDSDF